MGISINTWCPASAGQAITKTLEKTGTTVTRVYDSRGAILSKVVNLGEGNKGAAVCHTISYKYLTPETIATSMKVGPSKLLSTVRGGGNILRLQEMPVYTHLNKTV